MAARRKIAGRRRLLLLLRLLASRLAVAVVDVALAGEIVCSRNILLNWLDYGQPVSAQSAFGLQTTVS